MTVSSKAPAGPVPSPAVSPESIVRQTAGLEEMFKLPTAEEIKKFLCPKATDGEVWMFLNTCQATRLNPFKREIYLVKYDESKAAQIVTSYLVFLKRAAMHPHYKGFQAEILAVGGACTGAICTIFRSDREKPFTWQVSMKEFNKNQSTWNAMPLHMIRKVAIKQAHEMCFPEIFAGLPPVAMEVPGVIEVEPEVIDKPSLTPKPDDTFYGGTAPAKSAETEPAPPEPALENTAVKDSDIEGVFAKAKEWAGPDYKKRIGAYLKEVFPEETRAATTVTGALKHLSRMQFQTLEMAVGARQLPELKTEGTLI